MTIRKILSEEDTESIVLKDHRADLKRLRKIWEEDDLVDDTDDDIDIMLCERAEDHLSARDMRLVSALEEKIIQASQPRKTINREFLRCIPFLATAAAIVLIVGALWHKSSGEVLSDAGYVELALIGNLSVNDPILLEPVPGPGISMEELNSLKNYDFTDIAYSEEARIDYDNVVSRMTWANSELAEVGRSSRFSVEITEETRTFSDAGNLLGSDGHKEISGYVMDILPIIRKNPNIKMDELQLGDFLQAVVKIRDGDVLVEQIYIRHREVGYRYQDGEWDKSAAPTSVPMAPALAALMNKSCQGGGDCFAEDIVQPYSRLSSAKPVTSTSGFGPIKVRFLQ